MKFAVVLVCCLLIGGTLAKEEVEERGGFDPAREDPCRKKYCSPGYQCDIDEDNQAFCTCVTSCESDPDDPRSQVCSTNNVTFSSECEMYRQRCLCKKGKECKDKEFKLHYYGACKKLQECRPDELEEFNQRMEDWLYQILLELDGRKNALDKESKRIAREVKRTKNKKKKKVLPIIWEFCALDVDHNMMMNPQELLTITAPLIPMEHCLPDFINTCDRANDEGKKDRRVTIKEWITCLLEKGENDDLAGMAEKMVDLHCGKITKF